MLRLCVGYDAKQDRWLMMQLLHHLAGDHTHAGSDVARGTSVICWERRSFTAGAVALPQPGGAGAAGGKPGRA